MKMNNERYNQIIDDAYEKALMKYGFNWLPGTPPGTHFETQETFINKCKTDSEFSQEFGLKIEDRELNLEERTQLARGKVIPLLGSKEDSYNEAGIPTKLITLTYNNETIEVYE